nr:segmentation polarity homeobox protein engrailed-like [Ipomoea batatas]
MRSFLVSARSVAPATKISLGSKKDEASKSDAQASDPSVPSSLPLTTTRPASPKGEASTSRTSSKRGKEKAPELEIEEIGLIKRHRRPNSSSKTLVVDILLKHDDDPPAALLSKICTAVSPPKNTSRWSTNQMAHSVTDLFVRARKGDEIHQKEIILLKKALSNLDTKIKELELQLVAANLRAENAEKLVTDPLFLANHVCKETRVVEVFLSAVSRTPVREDLLYTYGTWVFNGGYLSPTELRYEDWFDGAPCSRGGHLSPTELRSNDRFDRTPCSRGGHLAPTKLRHLAPTELRSEDWYDRAPYSRGGHFAPIELKSEDRFDRAPCYQDEHLDPTKLRLEGRLYRVNIENPLEDDKLHYK